MPDNRLLRDRSSAPLLAMRGSKWVTNATVTGGKRVYAIVCWSDEVTVSAITCDGADAASLTVVHGITYERGDVILGLGNISAVTIAGTAQLCYAE